MREELGPLDELVAIVARLVAAKAGREVQRSREDSAEFPTATTFASFKPISGAVPHSMPSRLG